MTHSFYDKFQKFPKTFCMGEGSNLLVHATTCCHHRDFLLGAIYPKGRTDRKTIKDY